MRVSSGKSFRSLSFDCRGYPVVEKAFPVAARGCFTPPKANIAGHDLDVRFGSLADTPLQICGVRSYPISGPASAAAISLIFGIFSLLHVLEFPVLFFREFANMSLKLGDDRTPGTQRKAGFRKIPCLFPC